MDIRESLWKSSKSIGEFMATSKQPIVSELSRFFFMTGFFFHSDWEISLGPTTQIHKPTHVLEQRLRRYLPRGFILVLVGICIIM